MSLLLELPGGSREDLRDEAFEFGALSIRLLPGTSPAAALVQLVGASKDALICERRDDSGTWTAVDVLDDRGATAVLGAGTRFFFSGRQATTMCVVKAAQALVAPAAAPAAVAAAARARSASPPPSVVLKRGGAPGSGDGGPPKRQRPESAAGEAGGPSVPREGGVASGGPAGAGAVTPEPPSSSSHRDPPLHLMRVRGIPEVANDGFLGLRLRDVVCGDMRWALAANFMIDAPFLLSACPDLGRAARLVVVYDRRGEGTAGSIRDTLRRAGLLDRACVHAPPLPSAYSTHHSKWFMLEYERGLRLVVHTANLVYPDCVSKTQAVWHQDFPLKHGESPPTSEFERYLGSYLAALRLPPADAARAAALVAAHDFSAARAALVASVPGTHAGAAMRAWGHLRLREVLGREPELGAEFAGAPLFAQYTSVGSLTDKLTGEFAASLAAGSAGGKRLGPPPPGPAGLKLVWPTAAEVRDSLEGWFGGTSIPGRADNVCKPFLAPYYHRWGGEPCGRQRAAPHHKSFGRFRVTEGGEAELAWYCATSHNLSKAAWGTLEKGESQLRILSFELGVVLLPSLERAYQNSRWRGFSATAPPPPAAEAPAPPPERVQRVRFCAWRAGAPQAPVAEGGSVLRVPLPVPFPLPPAHYGPGDRAWCVDPAQRWEGVDFLGFAFPGRGAHYGWLDSMEPEDVVAALRADD